MSLMKHTPQALTLANLFCGFASVVLVTSNRPLLGVIVLFPAFIFDLLDGLVARRFGWKSALGRELDSLADEVSFVIAPGFIIAILFFGSSMFGFVIAGISIIFGTIRLARFNITKEKGYFEGMSVPYFTAFIIAIYIILFSDPIFLINPLVMAVCLVIVSSMQVSSVRFPSLKSQSFLRLKFSGIVLLVLFIASFFFGDHSVFFDFFFQAAFILVILLPLLLSKLVKRKVFVYLFIILFVLFSLWADLLVGHPPLIQGLPFLFSVVFSPLIQLSIEK